MKTQAEEEPTKTSSDALPETTSDNNVLDFVNEIKNTAIIKSYEQAGFIYEPSSGLYW